MEADELRKTEHRSCRSQCPCANKSILQKHSHACLFPRACPRVHCYPKKENVPGEAQVGLEGGSGFGYTEC